MSNEKSPIALIERLTKIGIALSAEKNIENFFKMVLNEAILYTNADGGTIYTVTDDGKFLKFSIIYNKTMNIKLKNVFIDEKWPKIPLYDENGKKMMKNFVSYVVHTGEPAIIDDVYNQEIFDNSGTKKYDKANNYHSKSMVAIPLKNHENTVIGVIQLINAMNDKGEVVPFSQRQIALLTSLASQAAIAFSNNKLIKNLEKLLEDFIKSIATALDRKSKYTGGHIQRVATLAEMITQKIQNDKKYFSNVRFDQNQIKEISIAAWMHDIGKITTPVYVMDKSTKLETIFDRIELVNNRLELIEKIIEIDFLKGKLSQEEFEKLTNRLENYKKFINNANIGNEFMKDEDVALVDEIFDFDYLHDGKRYKILTKNEADNLKIRKGTLSFEEIEKMREHVYVTYEMLSKLTFPKKYKNVPLYASEHHEKLNGKGYPFHLKEKEIPLQSRILAIADLFEALTAADRPYKKGKTLTETLKIMAFMAKDNDIDKNLLNLLIDSGIILEYAKKFLKPEQIDNVDYKKIKAIYS